jgi:nucleoside-diphosphate-sugar epimerase
MRLLVTGGAGVLGRTQRPRAEAAGHTITAPGREELDLFDPLAVTAAVRGHDAVLQLATRIGAWEENDRLRAGATRLLVDAALKAGTAVFVQPTVTFVYPPGPANEDTPLGDVPAHLRSALDAERETRSFALAGRRGVVLRLGLLDGPGTGNEAPVDRYGATLHVADAARALITALMLPSGTYNVCRPGGRVACERFARIAGWRPR